MPRKRRPDSDWAGRLPDHLCPERLDRALQVLNTTESVDMLTDVASVLAQAADARLRPALLDRYHALAAVPARDRGCGLRTAVVRALRGLAQPVDAAVLEHAAMTHEFMKPGPREVAGDLRRAALLCLHDVDPELAALHAVHLLTDDHRLLSGEPALTAARVLREQGSALPLYECVLRHPDCGAEVLAECLPALASLPVSLVSELFMRLGTDESDAQVLVALFDLALAHPGRQALLPQIHAFLQATARADIYAFVVTSIAALRVDPLVSLLDQLAGVPQVDPRKQEALGQALALLPHRLGP